MLKKRYIRIIFILIDTNRRDEKILNDIIKPKDKLIEELYQDNVALHKELSKQAKTIEEAEKYPVSYTHLTLPTT